MNEDTKETINNLESKYFGHNKDRHNGPEMEKSDGVSVSNEISHIVENKSEDPTFLNKSEINKYLNFKSKITFSSL